MNDKLRSESVDQLFKGILELETVDECYSFFEDLCTIGELVSMSQRFEVAKMLKEGQTYLAISAKTGASTATISRVNRSLTYGNDGYDLYFHFSESASTMFSSTGSGSVSLASSSASLTSASASLRSFLSLAL